MSKVVYFSLMANANPRISLICTAQGTKKGSKNKGKTGEETRWGGGSQCFQVVQDVKTYNIWMHYNFDQTNLIQEEFSISKRDYG